MTPAWVSNLIISPPNMMPAIIWLFERRPLRGFAVPSKRFEVMFFLVRWQAGNKKNDMAKRVQMFFYGAHSQSEYIKSRLRTRKIISDIVGDAGVKQ